MRIGAFELDCAFNPCFALAETASGAARVLRFVRIRNVRGTRTSWLRLYAEIDGRRTRQKPVRELAPGDELRAAELERDIREALVAPKGLESGRHTGRLKVFCDSGEEAELPFDFEVLDEHTIPTDFVRSILLAAYLREDDALRGFAAEAVGGADLPAEQTLRRLYEALLEKQLSYQPPVNTRFPDCQRVSDMLYVLDRGGSCADLSLLTASLIWCRGQSPALLLFPGHMAAGCFAGESLPDFDTLEDAGAIIALIRSGALILVEVTALCGYRQEGFQLARQRILERLESGGEPCQLVNVTQALRSGKVALLARQSRTLRCPRCGYDGVTREQMTNGEPCPACGQPLAPEPPEAPQEPEGVAESSGRVQCALSQGVATVQRLLETGLERVRIAPVWQGHALRRVGERAFERCGAKQILLPDSITAIGSYAFYGCTALESLRLPEDLREIGAGAFCGSGLRRVRIPGGVERVSRMAFSGCDRLMEVTLDEGIRQIDARAFADCPRLRSIRIPASVARVARGAFDPGCELLLTSGKTVVER